MPIPTTRAPQLPVMIDLTTISTPHESAIVARPGKVDTALIEQAQQAHIRLLPIVDEQGGCSGTITVDALQQLASSGQALTTDQATSSCERLPHLVPIVSVMQALVDDGMVLHAADPDDDLPEGWFGIVTAADVNRPLFRSHIYRMIAILESWLGQLIMEEFGDDWGAIRLLSEGTQRRIKDFWEEEKAEGVDLSPVTNATLSDLFHITTTSNRVWSLLGYDSPEQLRPVAHVINDLRNNIMHPVRPLIVNEAELQQVQAGVEAIDDVTNRLAKQIGFAAG